MSVQKQWAVPLIAALLFVLILRMYFFSFYIVQSENMNNTLQKKDIVLIKKNAKIKKNNIVLIQQKANKLFSRCVAVPGDTLLIRKAEIFLNGHKFKQGNRPQAKISEAYILKTNRFTQKLLWDKKISFDKQLSYFGLYKINTDEKTLKDLIKNSNFYSIKKIILPAGIFDDHIRNFVNRFYWNVDNTGKIIIPCKGMKIELNPYNYELYKKIIKNETGNLPKRIHSKIYIEGKPVKTYTFKKDYYFVINDNRPTKEDSRYFGFICEDEIIGKLVLKLK